MPLLRPTLYFHSVCEITPQLLREREITALVLDVDNTLATHGHPIPFQGVSEWLDRMRLAGIKLLILSNNSRKRVAPFADRLGLAFTSRAFKPLSFGLRRACRQMGTAMSQTAIVGDQLFTDVLCGNLAGAKTVLLDPISPEEGPLFRFKRVLERPFRKRYPREGN